VEPESTGARQSELPQSLSLRRDDFIVSVNNLGFNVCPDRPQLPQRLDKNEPMGKECKCLADLSRALAAMFMALSLAFSWGSPR
jgi:hypothetical protein